MLLCILCMMLAMQVTAEDVCIVSYNTDTAKINMFTCESAVSGIMQGRAGKRGPPGSPGQTGHRGPPGPKGEVPEETLSAYDARIQQLETATESLNTAWVRYMYHLSSSWITWQEAKTYCESRGERLATYGPRDRNLYKLIYNEIVAPVPYAWVGLSDLEEEGRFVWLDGVEATQGNTPWGGGQPDSQGEEDCGVMKDPPTGIHDAGCSAQVKALCEKYP